MPQVLAALPEAPLLALAGRWDLTRGEHPALAAPLAEVFGKLPLFPSREEWAELAPLGLPIQLALTGHHTLLDAGPRHAANPLVLDEYLLAPVFVRDLCGRVIHTGLLPLPTPPVLPIFPVGCADVPASMAGAHYLEQTIFTHWNLLEVAPPAGVLCAGLPALQLRANYAEPAAYPYKIRPDTFYADGWRLPQVARVFARRVAGAESVGEAFMARWANRPAGQDYEAFYEAVNGASWFEELFLAGVSVISTTEAYNGAYQVGADFTLQGVEAGRAVAGLHMVLEERESVLPQGTILSVVAPGFVTATHVVPAQVVISRGPSLPPPDALLPNLGLPHGAVAPLWGACWLPTQPQHFAAPALWDWLPSGQFAQASGPLWCPQHYVYGSTAALVRATRRPVGGCESLLQLPASLQQRFTPVVALTGYDTLNERTRQERAANEEGALHGSALDTLPLAQPVAPLGYHLLPPEWPSLQQAAAFPERRPQALGLPACPPELATRLAPLAKAIIPATQLAKHHQVVSEPMRVALAASQLPLSEAGGLADWLPDLPVSQLQLNVKRLFANRQTRAALTLVQGGLPAALFRFKEAALAWRRLRYRLVTKYPGAWVQAEKQGVALQVAEGLAGVLPEEAHAQARALRQAGVTKVPAPAALPLQEAERGGKVKQRKKL